MRLINHLLTTISACAISIFLLQSCNKENTIHAKRKDITEAVYASGFLIPENEYKVYSLSDGYIVNKFLNDGDIIKNDQAIYKIQNDVSLSKNNAASEAFKVALSNASATSPVLADLNLKIKNAEAKFANDSLMFQRNKNLLIANAISQSQFDQASLTFEIAKNDLQSARQSLLKVKDQLQVDLKNSQSNLSSSGLDLNNYLVRSRMDGMVYETYKELGEAVRKNDLVALVGETKKILQLAVDQQDINKVKSGQEVVVKMDLTGSKIYHAHITKIYPAMNQNDQSFKVEAVFNDSTDFAFVHASVEANIIIDEKKNTLVIPLNALHGGIEVEIKNDGKNKMVKVQRGIANLEEVEITSGIDEQTEIIVAGNK